jgi:hypothetical protein
MMGGVEPEGIATNNCYKTQKKKLGVPYKQYLMSGIPPNQGS